MREASLCLVVLALTVGYFFEIMVSRKSSILLDAEPEYDIMEEQCGAGLEADSRNGIRHFQAVQ
jgi:hypothetical protein